MIQARSFLVYFFIMVLIFEFVIPSMSEARKKHKNRTKKSRSTSYKLPDKFDFPNEKFQELKPLEADNFDYNKQYTPSWKLSSKERSKLRKTLYSEAKQTCRDQYPPKSKKRGVSWNKLAENEAGATKSELGCDYTQADCVAKACVIAADEFEVDPHLLFCVLRRETYIGTKFHPMASQGGGNGLAQFTPPAFNEVMDDLFTKDGRAQEDSATYTSFINYFKSINETHLNRVTGHANFSFHQGKKNSEQKFPYVNFCDPVQSIGAAAAYLSILGAGPNLSAMQAAKYARKYNGNPKGGIRWAYGEFTNKCSNASKNIAVFQDLIRQSHNLGKAREDATIAAQTEGQL